MGEKTIKILSHSILKLGGAGITPHSGGYTQTQFCLLNVENSDPHSKSIESQSWLSMCVTLQVTIRWRKVQKKCARLAQENNSFAPL